MKIFLQRIPDTTFFPCSFERRQQQGNAMTFITVPSFSTEQLQKLVYDLLTQMTPEPSTSEEERTTDSGYKILLAHLSSVLEKRIELLSPDFDDDEFEEEWVIISWSILSVLARTSPVFDGEAIQSLNHLLVELVNRANPIRVPILSGDAETFWPGFHQLFNQTLHRMHDLYSQLDQPDDSIEMKLNSFCDQQLQPCLDAFRQMCVHHAPVMHTELRKIQAKKMSEMVKFVENDYIHVHRHYTICLYILGLLAARLQGFRYECSSVQSFYNCQPDTMKRMMNTVLLSYEQLLSDALLALEPSMSPILVTNNLFTFSCSTLSRSLFFKKFDVQIIGEETAGSIQEDIISVRCGRKSATQTTTFPSAALLAMKPTSGVKRNNAVANAIGVGNTAHKKSDVNSKESVCLQPSYSEKHHAWQTQYPHLLCTTRQKDAALLDSRWGQIGIRPIFYFYIRAKAYSPVGRDFYLQTLSLPFTIATRRNQDCQVQRMMSSYTGTCFWLYGTCTYDGLLMNWNDAPLHWNHFKQLCIQYWTVNAEAKRPLEEGDFDLLSHKMQCEECEDYSAGLPENKPIAFKNMLCPHLRFETENMTMRFSVWRGILEILQIFQEQKSNVKLLWDDYLLHGFLDSTSVVNLLESHTSCIMMRLTYIFGGSICVSYRDFMGELIHLEPIDLKKLQSKGLLDYLSDIAESAKIDYLLTAKMEIMTISDMMIKYKANIEEVKRVRGVVSNISDHGPPDQLKRIKFTPMRVAVVACREFQPPPPPQTPLQRQQHQQQQPQQQLQLQQQPQPQPQPQQQLPTENFISPMQPLPPAASLVGVPLQSVSSPQRHLQQLTNDSQVFMMQLQSLMKSHGKTANEVCNLLQYQIGQTNSFMNGNEGEGSLQHQHQHQLQQQHQHPMLHYMGPSTTNYEFC